MNQKTFFGYHTKDTYKKINNDIESFNLMVSNDFILESLSNIERDNILTRLQNLNGLKYIIELFSEEELNELIRSTLFQQIKIVIELYKKNTLTTNILINTFINYLKNLKYSYIIYIFKSNTIEHVDFDLTDKTLENHFMEILKKIYHNYLDVIDDETDYQYLVEICSKFFC